MIQPTKLLPIAFVFTGLVTVVDRAFNDEMTRLATIRQSFTTAIGDARGRLTANVWAALSDGQIQQNFELGNMNTVTQSLQGYVRPGEVSQLDLYDSGCNLLARVPQSGKPANDVCKVISAGKPVLMWDVNEQKEPVLVTIAAKQVAGKTVFASAQLLIDQTWLSLHHDLARLVADREMSIGPSGGAELWREGRLTDGSYALTMRVDGWFYRLVPELTGLALVPLRENFWIVYGALGLILLLALSETSSQSRRDQIERGLLEGWLREQSTTKIPGGGSSGQVPIDKSWSDLLTTAKTLISTRDEQRAQQLRLMSERLEGVTTRLREREIELAGSRRKLAEMSGLASLQQQLRHTTASFLHQMAQIREICETIYDLVHDGLGRHAKDLGVFVDRWQAGLNQGANREMAARKFFRSLVEAQGRLPGNSQLDDDMRQLSSITSGTLDQALHAAMLAKKVLESCESATQLTSLWHGIAERDDSVKSSDWVACLLTAQKLIQGDDSYRSLTFETLPHIASPDEMYPAVAKSALVSGFFHLYLGLLTGTEASKLTLPVVVRQKRIKEQASIILSLPSRHADASPSTMPSPQLMYHLDIARQILGACGLKVAVLPPTAAGHPVGITWSLPTAIASLPKRQAATKQDESESTV
ncbi:MAG: hypothetical protein WCL28_08655 [bacterium]